MTLTRTRPVPLGAWSRRAVCAGMDPNLFHPLSNLNGDPDVIRAKAVCAVCPVKRECLEHAMVAVEWGIWGGTTKVERDKLRKRRKLAAS